MAGGDDRRGLEKWRRRGLEYGGRALGGTGEAARRRGKSEQWRGLPLRKGSQPLPAVGCLRDEEGEETVKVIEEVLDRQRRTRRGKESEGVSSSCEL